MTAVDVDALDKLREAARPGPWHVGLRAGTGTGFYTADGFPLGSAGLSADAALIVAAVNALPELLAEVRRGRALRAGLEGLAETWERRARAYGEHDDRDKVTELRQRATALRAVVAALDPS